jgi:uncharacterized integral membrane protein (TIGR00697 family)
MDKRKYSMIFCFIMMLSVTSDLLADLLAIQLFTVGPISFTGGEFVFPIVYIVNDIVSEVYGYNTAKKAIWCGLAVNVYALGAMTVVAYLAGPGTTMYSYVIGDYGVASAIAVAIAGFSAYLVASFVNAYIMKWMKDRDKEKRFALRAIVSTLFGELCDSATFGLIACVCGLYAWSDFIPLTATVVVLKTAVEAICLPITTKAVKKIKAIEAR